MGKYFVTLFPQLLKTGIMKPFHILFLLFFGIWISAQENYVQINGSTNVNNFKCINNAFKTSGENLKQLPNIALKVTDFDCKNRIMTSDFQKTLSAKEYPYLSIKFLSFNSSNGVYQTQVEVKMMEKSKTYNVTFSLEDGKLIGKRNVKFSDFDITPPRKMGGMVVVRDELNLVFALAAN